MPNNLNKLTPDTDNAPVNVNQSKFFIRSMGRAAQNIDGVNPLLEIIPIEDLGYVHGEINVDREVIESTGVDMNGNAFSTRIETSNVILAEWLPLTSNRVSPPTIRRGERVLIWQYANHDKYYWTTCGLDENLRRLETAIWRYSNTRDEGDINITPDNSYWFEVSTHRKNITLMTSTSDGEQHKYTAQIDTNGSRLIVTDEIDNCVEIDSNAKKVSLRNAGGASVTLTGPDIAINAPGNISIKAGGSTSIASPAVRIDGDTKLTGLLTSNGKNISDSHAHLNSGGPGIGGSVA